MPLYHCNRPPCTPADDEEMNTLVMTHPSVLNHIPSLELNLHNSFLKGLSLLQCCLSVALLRESWHFADSSSGCTSCWETDWWGIYISLLERMGNVLFKYNLLCHNFKIRFSIASERLEANYYISPLCLWGCLRTFVFLIVFWSVSFVLFCFMDTFSCLRSLSSFLQWCVIKEIPALVYGRRVAGSWKIA